MSIGSGRLSCSPSSLHYLSVSFQEGQARAFRLFLTHKSTGNCGRLAPQPAMGLFILHKTHKRADHEPHSWHPTSSPPLPSHPWPWLVPLPQCLTPAWAAMLHYLTGWLAGWLELFGGGRDAWREGRVWKREGAGMFSLQSANWLTDVRRSRICGRAKAPVTLFPSTNKHNTYAHARQQRWCTLPCTCTCGLVVFFSHAHLFNKQICLCVG